MKHLIFALVACCLSAQEVRAQWHFNSPIDKVVTAKAMRAWDDEHGNMFVAIDGDTATVVNPYDHDGTARVARYRAIDVATSTRNGVETRIAVFAIEEICGDIRAARALTLGDYFRIAVMIGQLFVAQHSLAVAIVLGGWMLLSVFIFARPSVRRMETTSLCAEVERRFIQGARRW